MSNSEGFVLAYSGRLEAARLMSRLAADLARKAGRRETEALYESGRGGAGSPVRKCIRGKAESRASLDLSRSRDVAYGAAFAFDVIGDSSRSQALIEDLARRFPEDTRVQFIYAPTLRALMS